MRRVEEKIEENPSIFLLVYVNNPVYFVHGAYSSEKKVLAEIRRLSKQPENKLTRQQKQHNATCTKRNGKVKIQDPMDCFSIREVSVV